MESEIIRDHPWKDYSKFVTHFIKGKTPDSTLVKILNECKLLRGAGPFGAARGNAPNPDNQRCVCFSEVPFEFQKRMVERRSAYGIAFTKDFLRQGGGSPVWYLYFDSPQHQSLKQKMRSADSSDPIWQLTPFIDIPCSGSPYSYEFQWEREWRVANDVEFSMDDVAFICAPEKEHARIRKSVTHPITASILDPSWDAERIEAARTDVLKMARTDAPEIASDDDLEMARDDVLEMARAGVPGYGWVDGGECDRCDSPCPIDSIVCCKCGAHISEGVDQEDYRIIQTPKGLVLVIEDHRFEDKPVECPNCHQLEVEIEFQRWCSWCKHMMNKDD